MTDTNKLNAQEVQIAIAFIVERAQSQDAAEKGAMAAALSVTLATRGSIGAVEVFRDLSDVIEHCLVMPSGEVMQ